MIFDELKIKTIIDDQEELYVSVSDLSNHLAKAAQEFVDETKAISKIVKLTGQEKTFTLGLVNGMYNVIIMLGQSYDEHELNKINTIDELLEKFDNQNNWLTKMFRLTCWKIWGKIVWWQKEYGV